MKKIKHLPQSEKEVRRSFSVLNFFYLWKKKIIGAVILCGVITIGIGLFLLWQNKQEMKASFLLAKAETDGYEKLISDFPSSKTKPIFIFTWACELATKDKFDEAIALYSDFLKRYPRHKLVPQVFIGQAYCYEEKGNLKEAGDLFRRVKEEFPNTVWARDAEIGYKRVASS